MIHHEPHKGDSQQFSSAIKDTCFASRRDMTRTRIGRALESDLLRDGRENHPVESSLEPGQPLLLDGLIRTVSEIDLGALF